MSIEPPEHKVTLPLNAVTSESGEIKMKKSSIWFQPFLAKVSSHLVTFLKFIGLKNDKLD